MLNKGPPQQMINYAGKNTDCIVLFCLMQTKGNDGDKTLIVDT